MRRVALLALCATLQLPHPGHAQNRTGMWVMPVLGTYGEYGCSGFCGHQSVAFTASWQPSSVLVTARGTIAQGNNDAWEFKEVGALVGYGTRPGRRFHTHLGIGLGYGQANEGTEKGLTIPYEVQLAWHAFPVLGFALYGWGTMTGPLGGLGLGLQIGRLR